MDSPMHGVPDLQGLKEQHEAHIAGVIASGGRVLEYTTPCCGKPLTTQAPIRGETWDSLTACPYCDGLFMKVVTAESVGCHVPPPRLMGHG